MIDIMHFTIYLYIFFQNEIHYSPAKLPFQEGPLIDAKVSSGKLLTTGEDVKTVVELILDTNVILNIV